MNVDTLDRDAVVDAPARRVGAAASARAWVAAAGLAGAVTTLLRWWAVRNRREYTLWPDEPAQLAIARLIGGGTHWTMRNQSTWRPGYGTLLGPVYAVTDDPERVFRAAMAINGVLGGLAAVLLVVLARRLTAFGPLGAGMAATAVCATPALLFTTGFVWAESLIAPVFLGALLALVRFWETPSMRRGVGLAVLCGAGFVTHSRLLPLSLVTLLLVAMAVERRALRPRDAGVVVAALGTVLAAVARYSAWVTDRLWDEPSTRNSLQGVIEQLANPLAVVESGLGQTWYLLAGSLGVVALGAVEVVRRANHRGPFFVVALVVVAHVALSVVFMADRWRADQVIYGRYNDPVVAPLLLVGMACLANRAPGAWPRPRVVRVLVITWCATLGLGLTMWLARGDELRESNGLEPMILAIQPFVDGRPMIPLVRLSLLAITAGVVLLAGRLVGRAVGVAVVVAALLVGATLRTEDVIDAGWNGSGGLQSVGRLDDPGGPLSGGAPVDYYLPAASNATGRLMLYQWYLPHSDFTVVGQPLVQASSPYVFAERDNVVLREAGAEIVWTDPLRPIALWRRPSATADRNG